MTLDDHTEAAQRGHSAPPGADWMRPEGATRAIVVRGRSWADFHRKTLELVFPGACILTPGTPLLDDAFNQIIMLWRPETKRDRDWVQNELMLKLPRDGKFMYLV